MEPPAPAPLVYLNKPFTEMLNAWQIRCFRCRHHIAFQFWYTEIIILFVVAHSLRMWFHGIEISSRGYGIFVTFDHSTICNSFYFFHFFVLFIFFNFFFHFFPFLNFFYHFLFMFFVFFSSFSILSFNLVAFSACIRHSHQRRPHK